MTLLRLPIATTAIVLELDALNEATATFDHERATLTLDRDLWEEIGKPARIEAPLVTGDIERVDEPSDSGAS